MVCLADTDDGSFVTSLATGLTSGSVPCYATFNDLLIYSSDSSVDVPRSWDQTTSQNLAGSPPRFSFSCFHKNGIGSGQLRVAVELYYPQTSIRRIGRSRFWVYRHRPQRR